MPLGELEKASQFENPALLSRQLWQGRCNAGPWAHTDIDGVGHIKRWRYWVWEKNPQFGEILSISAEIVLKEWPVCFISSSAPAAAHAGCYCYNHVAGVCLYQQPLSLKKLWKNLLHLRVGKVKTSGNQVHSNTHWCLLILNMCGMNIFCIKMRLRYSKTLSSFDRVPIKEVVY